MRVSSPATAAARVTFSRACRPHIAVFPSGNSLPPSLCRCRRASKLSLAPLRHARTAAQTANQHGLPFTRGARPAIRRAPCLLHPRLRHASADGRHVSPTWRCPRPPVFITARTARSATVSLLEIPSCSCRATALRAEMADSGVRAPVAESRAGGQRGSSGALSDARAVHVSRLAATWPTSTTFCIPAPRHLLL